MTNYEKIKNMSACEMAEFISNLTDGCLEGCDFCAFNNGMGCTSGVRDNPFIEGCKQWLNKEAANKL